MSPLLDAADGFRKLDSAGSQNRYLPSVRRLVQDQENPRWTSANMA
jgi:hypothetical protein